MPLGRTDSTADSSSKCANLGPSVPDSSLLYRSRGNKASSLVPCTDLSGHHATYRRIVQTRGLPDLRLGVGMPEMQCRDQPVSGALNARPEILQRLRKTRPAEVALCLRDRLETALEGMANPGVGAVEALGVDPV